MLVGFNLKYDLHWARRHGILPPDGVRVWDCQIAEFIISGQLAAFPSLNEALARFDLGQKDDKIAEYWALGVNTNEIPVDELREYNVRDVDLTYQLYLKQHEVMSDRAKRLCILQGLDLLVLEEMEWNGVKFNSELSKQKAEETEAKLTEVSAALREALGCDSTVNLDSGVQLSVMLYGGAFSIDVVDSIEQRVYKSGEKKGQAYERTIWRTAIYDYPALFVPLKGSKTKLISKTEKGSYPVYATGEDVLKQLRKPTKRHRRIIDLILERAEYEKLLSTYYGALPKLIIDMEWEDGYLHGQLNQTIARTGRLSSSGPNMQNFSAAVDELLETRF